MAADKKSRTKTRVAVSTKSKSTDGIPTVTVPVASSSAREARTARGGKGKGKGRAAGIASSRPGPRARKAHKGEKAPRGKSLKPAARMDTPPVGLAPPEMTDTRPVRPAPPAKPRILDVEKVMDLGGITPNAAPEVVPETKPVNGKPLPTRDPTFDDVKPTPRTGLADANDRLVQGAQCTWIGYLSEAPDDPTKQRPVCPHCGHNLITAADEPTVQLGFEAFEMGAYTSINPPPRPHPGYKAMMAWLRQQPACWTTITGAADAYFEATGEKVDPTR